MHFQFVYVYIFISPSEIRIYCTLRRVTALSTNIGHSLNQIESLSILNKWIRMGLFFPFQYRSLEESRSQQYLSESTSKHFSFDTLSGCHRLKLVRVQSTPLKSNGSAIQRPISFPFADGWVADFFWTETYPNICSYLVKSGQIYQ